MRTRRIGITGAALFALSLGLSGCSSADPTCAEGYSPTFRLTVDYNSSPEPSVRFCDAEQCSPVPKAGAIAAELIDSANDHASLITHLRPGEWSIGPRGIKDAAPNSATISLYRNGALETSHTVHLDWPAVDPCAATLPPAPHATIQAD